MYHFIKTKFPVTAHGLKISIAVLPFPWRRSLLVLRRTNNAWLVAYVLSFVDVVADIDKQIGSVSGEVSSDDRTGKKTNSKKIGVQILLKSNERTKFVNIANDVIKSDPDLSVEEPTSSRSTKDFAFKHKDLDKLIIAGLGDLVESCSGHYPMQTFTTILDERQQKTLARQMLLDAFNRFSKDFNEVLGLCALGNHGEKRLGTKAYTTFGDNKDGELFDEVAQVLAADPSKKHVKFTIPGNSLAYSIEVLPGTVLTLAHGHQAKRGTTPAARVENWFNKMASKQSKGGFYATNVLLVGHYHHHWSKENERLLLGTTTIDDGSQWFEEGGGDKSLPGITTLVLHSNKNLRKWSDIEIL